MLVAALIFLGTGMACESSLSIIVLLLFSPEEQWNCSLKNITCIYQLELILLVERAKGSPSPPPRDLKTSLDY